MQNTTTLNSADHIIYGHKVAESMAKKIDLESREKELFEIMDTLNFHDFESTYEPYLDLECFITDIACLLTNPEISKKLSEPYNQLMAGKMLMAMMNFFRRLKDDDNGIQDYLLYGRLKHFSGGGTVEEISSIEKYHLNQAV